MSSMSLRDGANQNNQYRNSAQSFKGGGQPMSLKEQAGLIQGPGTGKSDSIDAKLPVKGFVLPVEVVQAIGPDKLQAMIDQFRGDSPTMDSEEVPAKVSNGEFFVPPEVVAKTGPEYWDSLVQQVTGSPAQPEISEEGVKAADGYGPNLSDERQAAQQFWSQPNRAVVPTPGRANPANPTDVMRDRLQASTANSQPQSQGLRAQINQNLANPVHVQQTPPTRLATVGITRNPAALHVTPPKIPSLMSQVFGAGTDIGQATGLASDVLQAPHIAKNRDDAISGLKARAGFKETDTPFQYAEGGYVQKFLGGGQPQSEDELKKYQNDLAQRRPDLLQQQPTSAQVNRNIGESEQRLYQNDLAQRKPELLNSNPQHVNISSQPTNGIAELNRYQADLAQRKPDLVGQIPTVQASQVTSPQLSLRQAVEPTLKGLNSAFREGANELGRTGLMGFVDKGQQAIQDVNQKYDPVISNAVGGAVDKVLYGTEGRPQETRQVQPASLKAAVFNPEQDKPKVVQANEQAAPSLKEAVAQSEGVRNITGKPVQSLDDQGFYTVTGENGATAKVLDWNTTQNSFQQTMGADDYNRLQAQNQDYQNQRNAAVIGGSNSYEKGEKGTYRASSSTDGFTPNSGLNLGSSAERTENAPKYNMKDGIIYQESGSSADEFNAKIPKTTNGVDPRAAQLINIIETGDADAQKEGRSLLAKHFPDIFTKYTIGLK
jgi:hypothetical protein